MNKKLLAGALIVAGIATISYLYNYKFYTPKN